MILDSHAHIANTEDVGGFKARHIDADELLALMDGPFEISGVARRVDVALVQPMISPTRIGDPDDHHRYVAASVKAHPDRLVGCFVANPLLDLETTLDSFTRHILNMGFRGLKLHPVSHGYHLLKLRDRIDPLLAAAGELGVPVLVHQGDPPFGHPSHVGFLAEAFPSVRFIIAHFGRQRVVMSDEAIYVASKNSNIYLETGWGDLPRLKEGITALGTDRLIFGSDCPILEIGSQLRVLDVLGWPAPMGIDLPVAELEGVLGDNAASLFSISV